MSELKEYYSLNCCTNCHNILTSNQQMYSNGTCPMCGNISKSTIVDSYKRLAYRVEVTQPWWKFWTKTYKSSWAEDNKLDNKE